MTNDRVDNFLKRNPPNAPGRLCYKCGSETTVIGPCSSCGEEAYYGQD